MSDAAIGFVVLGLALLGALRLLVLAWRALRASVGATYRAISPAHRRARRMAARADRLRKRPRSVAGVI